MHIHGTIILCAVSTIISSDWQMDFWSNGCVSHTDHRSFERKCIAGSWATFVPVWKQRGTKSAVDGGHSAADKQEAKAPPCPWNCCWGLQEEAVLWAGEAGAREVFREENSMVPSEIPWLKPGRLQALSRAEMEFPEHMVLIMPRHTVTKVLHPHPNGAFTPVLCSHTTCNSFACL